VKLAGAGLVATTLVGNATAHGGAVEGAPENLGDGSVHAYVKYDRGRGRLSAIGVHLDGAALENLNDVPPEWPFPGVPEGVPYSEAYHLDLPRGNTGHFSYVGLDWNPAGHEPPGLYTHPHFDVHFYMPSEAEIAAIPPGEAAYDIPDELMPAATGYAPGRGVVPGMGEHLLSPISAPQDPGKDGWSVFIWGAYDMDGDDEGRMIFMEPMVTVKYLQRLANAYPTIDEVRRPIPMPERFYDGGWYPTQFVVAYDGEDFTISLESFDHFPGYDA
jgi:hypothetical protein